MSITIGNLEDVVIATQMVNHRQVVSCPNPADAASPVTLIGGDFSRQIGQSATWQHRIEKAAAAYDADEVCGYWDSDAQAWYVTTTADEAKVLEIVRQRVYKRASEAEAKRDAERRAEQAIRDKNRNAINAVTDKLKSAGVYSPVARIGGKLLPTDRLTEGSAADVAALEKASGGTVWDVLCQDGSLHRVKLASMADSWGGAVAKLELRELAHAQ